MTILKNLVVKNGSYTDRDGNEKGRYVTIGQVHKGEHGQYITLDAHINLAAFPRKEGDSRVMVNLYDPKGKDETPRRQEKPSEDFDSDIPF